MLSKEIKTSELNGIALDWAVAKCKWEVPSDAFAIYNTWRPTNYSTDWARGGPILEKAKIEVFIRDEKWLAYSSLSIPEDFNGNTPLIAAMRCFVAAHMGSSVSVPVKLLEEN